MHTLTLTVQTDNATTAATVERLLKALRGLLEGEVGADTELTHEKP